MPSNFSSRRPPSRSFSSPPDVDSERLWIGDRRDPPEVGLTETTFELHFGDEVYGLTAEDGRFSVSHRAAARRAR
jgi:hypothetical protein